MRRVILVFLCLAILLTTLGCKKAKQNQSEIIKTTAIISNPSHYNDPPWYLLLVNPWNPVPEGYAPVLKELRNGYTVDERIYPELQKMFDHARSADVYPLIVSAYRTQEKQESLFQEKASSYMNEGYSREKAEELAGKWVAKPGFSEHQTGLAVDINAESENINDVYQWLKENSYQYGFILRYPEHKTDITGINYEPWHFRYVGKDSAKYIYENNITLEEYLLEINSPVCAYRQGSFFISFWRQIWQSSP